jgi:hypothetical protein
MDLPENVVENCPLFIASSITTNTVMMIKHQNCGISPAAHFQANRVITCKYPGC